MKKAKEREQQDEKVSAKVKQRADRNVEQRSEQEDKRKHGRGPADPLAGTSREGGEFEVLQGRCFLDGTYYGIGEPAGKFVESDLPLDELFENKFRRVGGMTKLGRDSRRDKNIDSEVMDRPLAQRREREMELDDEDDEDMEDDTEDEEEEPRKKMGARRKAAAKASDEDGVEADPVPEGDEEEAEAVDKAARMKKAKRAKLRARK
jgi:hypothetical protein